MGVTGSLVHFLLNYKLVSLSTTTATVKLAKKQIVCYNKSLM